MRRKPSQQRSRHVVDTLIEATAQTIAERGLEQATTNHIAARAGVSVGSVYQYFGNKEELVAALLDRLADDLGKAVDRGLPLLLESDLRTTVRGLLLAGFGFVGGNEKLYLELARNWDRLSTQRFLRTLERHLQEVFRLYAMRHYRDLHYADLPLTVFVVTHSMIFTILHYLSLPQPPCRREALIAELTEMAAGYLERRAAA